MDSIFIFFFQTGFTLQTEGGLAAGLMGFFCLRQASALWPKALLSRQPCESCLPCEIFFALISPGSNILLQLESIPQILRHWFYETMSLAVRVDINHLLIGMLFSGVTVCNKL